MARKSATISNHSFSKAAAFTVAVLPLLPAIIVNVETAASGSFGWTLAAIASVIMAAVFIYASTAAGTWSARIGFLIAGLLCFAGNLQNAMINASTVSDYRSTDRRTAVSEAAKAKSQRALWTQSRNSQAITAGNTSVAEYDAMLERHIAADANRWRLTRECAPTEITLRASQEFCATVADIRAKRAAAAERDRLDAQIAELDGREIPDADTIDPYAVNVVHLAALAGLDVSAHVDIISRSPVIVKTAVLEIMAAFGPTAVLAVAAYLFGWHKVPVPPAARAPIQAASPTQEVPSNGAHALTVPSGDPTHAFIAECLEPAPGSVMPAGEVWQLWQDWCGKRGEQPGSRKAFGTRLKTMVASEKNNNRPRYLNVRAK